MAEQKLPDKAQETEMKREKVRVVPIKYTIRERKIYEICTFVFQGRTRMEVSKMFKRKKKFQIPVSAYEYRMILDALMSSREKLMAQGRYTDAVDDALLAVCK